MYISTFVVGSSNTVSGCGTIARNRIDFFSSTIRSLPRHGFPGPLSGAI